MFQWFHCEGWQSGPYPPEEIEALKAKVLAQNPMAVIQVEPAWEAPFEKMPRVLVRQSNYGGADIVTARFLHRVDKKFYWFVINTRCSLKIKRADGREPYKQFGQPCRIEASAMQAIDSKVRDLTGGKDVWDCGWTPGC